MTLRREAVPVVFKIIRDAELKLTELTGTKIILNMTTEGEFVTQKELQKLKLQKLVCDHFSVGWKEIASPLRLINFVDARRVYCYLAITILGQTLAATGKDIRRDHTSVMYLRDRCKELIEINDPIVNAIDHIKNLMNETNDKA